jgi:hypothetical protein
MPTPSASQQVVYPASIYPLIITYQCQGGLSTRQSESSSGLRGSNVVIALN